MDRRARSQAFPGEPALADRRVISVGHEIVLGRAPHENRGHAKVQGDSADQRPGPLIARRDRVTPRDCPGKVTDDEGEVGRAAQDALEIGEASAGAPFPVSDLEVVRHASQHYARNRGRVHDLQLQWHAAMQPPSHP